MPQHALGRDHTKTGAGQQRWHNISPCGLQVLCRAEPRGSPRCYLCRLGCSGGCCCWVHAGGETCWVERGCQGGVAS
jgi:hypothetical protein